MKREKTKGVGIEFGSMSTHSVNFISQSNTQLVNYICFISFRDVLTFGINMFNTTLSYAGYEWCYTYSLHIYMAVE